MEEKKNPYNFFSNSVWKIHLQYILNCKIPFIAWRQVQQQPLSLKNNKTDDVFLWKEN